MSEEFETQQGQMSQQIDSYADPNAAADKGKEKKDKKKMSGSTMAATVVSFAVVYLFCLRNVRAARRVGCDKSYLLDCAGPHMESNCLPAPLHMRK